MSSEAHAECFANGQPLQWERSEDEGKTTGLAFVRIFLAP
jgi:hypothetical protein